MKLSRRSFVLPLMLAWLLVLLPACSLPQMLAWVSHTPTATPAPPATTDQTAPCGYAWARQELPDVTEEAQALVDAVLQGVTVRATAFGENCINPDGTVRHFLTMSTDISATVPVTAFDADALASIVVTLADTLQTVSSAPARLEWLEIVFQSGGEERRLRTQFATIDTAVASGLSGADLLAALGWQP